MRKLARFDHKVPVFGVLFMPRASDVDQVRRHVRNGTQRPSPLFCPVVLKGTLQLAKIMFYHASCRGNVACLPALFEPLSNRTGNPIA